MSRVSFAVPFRMWLAATIVAGLASPVFAVNYTWSLLSGTGDWTTSTNWTGTTATDLYPGSTTGTDAAFIQNIYTSAPTINLNTSVTLRQLNLGGTTGANTFPVTVSTNNGSTLTFVHPVAGGTAILAVNSSVNSGVNTLEPNIFVNTTTWETRMASVTSGSVNLAITGNVSGGSAGSKIVRYTPNNTSTTTSPSFLEYRGNITNGSGTVSMYYRNDMPNSQNTLRLTGTGNMFTGGVSFVGGKPGTTLEASPASGTNGALGTGLFQLGTGGSSAVLNMGGSLSTVTEVCGITIAGSGARRIAVIGAGDRILSGTVNQATTGGLTLACSAAGDLTLSNAISGAGPITISSTGSGKVIFSGSNTYSGTTTISQGTLQLGSAYASGSSAFTVASAGTLAVGPQVATTVRTLVNNGLVDVGLGGLTVTTGQTAEGIVAGIVAGRDGGGWTGASGITSSAAATQSERAVGWLDNGDGSFTVSFGAAGDWNLNGVVDFDDVVQFVSANLYDTGLPATWADGDYDYNGVVDFDDVVASVSANLFDAGPYNTAPGGLALQSFMGFGGDDPGLMSGGFTAVPEPATWVLVALGALCAAAKRRQARGAHDCRAGSMEPS